VRRSRPAAEGPPNAISVPRPLSSWPVRVAAPGPRREIGASRLPRCGPPRGRPCPSPASRSRARAPSCVR
jgi:hypothetical protein